jgi:hypothetical protein
MKDYPVSQGLHSNPGIILDVSRTVATPLLTGRVVNTYLLFAYSAMTSKTETLSRKGHKTLNLSLRLFSCPSELFFYI